MCEPSMFSQANQDELYTRRSPLRLVILVWGLPSRALKLGGPPGSWGSGLRPPKTWPETSWSSPSGPCGPGLFLSELLTYHSGPPTGPDHRHEFFISWSRVFGVGWVLCSLYIFSRTFNSFIFSFPSARLFLSLFIYLFASSSVHDIGRSFMPFFLSSLVHLCYFLHSFLLSLSFPSFTPLTPSFNASSSFCSTLHWCYKSTFLFTFDDYEAQN